MLGWHNQSLAYSYKTWSGGAPAYKRWVVLPDRGLGGPLGEMKNILPMKSGKVNTMASSQATCFCQTSKQNKNKAKWEKKTEKVEVER